MAPFTSRPVSYSPWKARVVYVHDEIDIIPTNFIAPTAPLRPFIVTTIIIHATTLGAEECETAIMIQMDAINLLCSRGLQLQGPAPAGIAALGRVLEFLI